MKFLTVIFGVLLFAGYLYSIKFTFMLTLERLLESRKAEEFYKGDLIVLDFGMDLRIEIYRKNMRIIKITLAVFATIFYFIAYFGFFDPSHDIYFRDLSLSKAPSSVFEVFAAISGWCFVSFVFGGLGSVLLPVLVVNPLTIILQEYWAKKLFGNSIRRNSFSNSRRSFEEEYESAMHIAMGVGYLISCLFVCLLAFGFITFSKHLQ